jgi:hypothetical protein
MIRLYIEEILQEGRGGIGGYEGVLQIPEK